MKEDEGAGSYSQPLRVLWQRKCAVCCGEVSSEEQWVKGVGAIGCALVRGQRGEDETLPAGKGYGVSVGMCARSGVSFTGPSSPDSRGAQWAAVNSPVSSAFSRRRAAIFTL